MRRRPISTLHLVLDLAEEGGICRERLLELRGHEDWLELPIPERIRRADAVWRLVLDELEDPGFPIRYARRVRIEDLGILGLAVRSAHDLRQALERIDRFQGLFTPQPPWHFDFEHAPGVSSAILAVPLSADPEIAAVLSEAWIAELVALIRQITGTSLPLIEVRFHHAARGDATPHREHFGIEPSWQRDWSGLVFACEALVLPLVHSDDAISDYLFHQLDQLADEERERRQPTLEERLRRRIAEALPDGVPSLAQLAPSLAMSERTLRRRLADSGTGWRQLVEETRRHLALEMLRDPSYDVGQLAWLLGYSEPSAFHRAFRRWTGRTPGEWREGRASD